MKWAKSWHASLILLVLILSTIGAKRLLDGHIKSRPKKEDFRLLPSPQTAKFLSFGFEAALADLYWIEGINYYGSELSNKNRTYKYLKNYTDLIFELDPLFTVFYDWAATMFIYNGLDITRERIIISTDYANRGILNLNAVHRFDYRTIVKAAFNYAMEARVLAPSIAYFELAGRSFTDRRDMLLVASSYSQKLNLGERSASLRLEYLGQKAFETTNQKDLLAAIGMITSSSFGSQVLSALQGLRIRMEKDEDVQKLVRDRMKSQTVFQSPPSNQDSSIAFDPRVDRLLAVDFSRTWMPSEMLVLFSL